MDNTKWMDSITAAVVQLGYGEPEHRGSGHWRVRHPVTGKSVGFAATPSDWRALRNVISALERNSGRRMPRKKGYSGGNSGTKARIAELNRSRSVGRFSVSTLAEDRARESIRELTAGIRTIDRQAVDALKQRNVEQLRLLMESRERYSEVLEKKYHQPPVEPETSEDGVDWDEVWEWIDGNGSADEDEGESGDSVTDGCAGDETVEIDDDLLADLNESFG